MYDEVRMRKDPRNETDQELTTADLAGARQHKQTEEDATSINNERRAAERVDARTAERSANDPGRISGPGPAVPVPAMAQDTGPLFSGSEANELRGKWDAIQVGFVDEPRRAVEQADNLVAGTMKRLAEIFTEERGKLEGHWDKGENVSTEDLRLALRRYRSFFTRLLSV
jgi:hypothetical protein